jgi:hypothetical protein
MYGGEHPSGRRIVPPTNGLLRNNFEKRKLSYTIEHG